MNDYGLGAALAASFNMATMASRRTGRTRALLRSLRNGDVVVFSDGREADRIKRECRRRGINISPVVCEPTERAVLTGVRPGPHHRVLFDHMWIEKFYANQVDMAIGTLTSLQTEVNREPPEPDIRQDEFDARYANLGIIVDV